MMFLPQQDIDRSKSQTMHVSRDVPVEFLLGSWNNWTHPTQSFCGVTRVTGSSPSQLEHSAGSTVTLEFQSAGVLQVGLQRWCIFWGALKGPTGPAPSLQVVGK